MEHYIYTEYITPKLHLSTYNPYLAHYYTKRIRNTRESYTKRLMNKRLN